jgi:excisionase family DNA binding protein
MESKPAISDILTVKEAATYLRISPWTLRHWVSRGKVTHLKYLDGAVRFRKRDLDHFILRNLKSKEANPTREETQKK